MVIFLETEKNDGFKNISRAEKYSAEFERYGKDQRLELVSRTTDLDPTDIADCIANETREHTYKHNVYLFHRAFSLNRERFGQEILPGLIQGAITENITGCKSKDNYEILKKLYFHTKWCIIKRR